MSDTDLIRVSLEIWEESSSSMSLYACISMRKEALNTDTKPRTLNCKAAAFSTLCRLYGCRNFALEGHPEYRQPRDSNIP